MADNDGILISDSADNNAVKKSLWSGIKSVLSGLFAAKNHTHTKENITDFPASLPANGGNADTVDGKHAADFLSLTDGAMTNQITFNTGTSGAFLTNKANINKGDIPTSDVYSEINIIGKEDTDSVGYNRLGLIQSCVATDGSTNMTMIAYHNVANTNEMGALSITYPSSGTPYGSSPNPETGTNEKIATTDWVKKQYITAGRLGSSTLGKYATAEGLGNLSSGKGAHAEGHLTKALGTYSHTEGEETEASGQNSHAEGLRTKASGLYCHSEGRLAEATNANSHAEGYNTRAAGEASHAEGRETKAEGAYSHSEGCYTIASGFYSHAEGHSSVASGIYSHAQGRQIYANTQYMTAIGIANVYDASASNASSGDYFVIGNGTSDTVRSNAFRVHSNGTVYGEKTPKLIQFIM